MCYLTLQMEEELCEISHANFHVNYIGHFFFTVRIDLSPGGIEAKMWNTCGCRCVDALSWSPPVKRVAAWYIVVDEILRPFARTCVWQAFILHELIRICK